MDHKTVDITILTDPRYVDPKTSNDYIENVLLEDRLVQEAIERKGMTVKRVSWDDPEYKWDDTSFVLFRTTWDYFDRFPEFVRWMNTVQDKTHFINPKELILWNIDKKYLKELELKSIHIPSTIIIEEGDQRPLSKIINLVEWTDIILKPTVSGAARHTYRFRRNDAGDLEEVFRELIKVESMMIQEFQHQIMSRGEVALMLFGGKFSHAILKRAKEGDFRVQDDHGGTVHEYTPTKDEIQFAERCIEACPIPPVYARVDLLWDNNNKPALGELELIEPELWFRKDENAADRFATALKQYCQLQVHASERGKE